jgi:hypothetical protein
VANFLLNRYNNNKPPVGVQLNRNHPLTKGLIGCWIANQGAGKQLLDLAIGDNASNWSGPVYDNGGGLKFAAADRLTNSKLINIPQCTIVTSVKLTTSIAVDGFVAGFKHFSDDATFDKVLFTNPTPGFYIYDGSIKIVSATTSMQVGRYYQLIAVNDGTNIKIYVNGTLEGTLAAGNSYTSYASGPNFFFNANTVGNYKNIDNNKEYVYLYDRALSDTEIKELYLKPYVFLSYKNLKASALTTEAEHWLYLIQLIADSLDTMSLSQFELMELDQPINTFSLYTLGHIASSGNIPLSMTGMIPVSGTVPLYTHGYSSGTNTMSLYTMGASYVSQTMSLFIQVDKEHGILPMFLKGQTPVRSSGQFNLFTVGSSSGTSYEYKHLSLYTNADPYHESLPLMITGEGVWTNNNTQMSLYTYGEGLPANNSLNLYTQGATNAGVSGIVNQIYNNTTLYIEGDGFADGYYPTNTSMNLYLKGGTGASSGISLYTKGYGLINNNCSMYTMGISGSLTNSFNLYTRGVGVANSGLRLFTRGYIN